MTPRLAVIGAGPVGLEMALAASDAGYDVQVYEAGRVGESLEGFGGVPLFTPFSMNSTQKTRDRLSVAGVSLPDGGKMQAAVDLVERYLKPIGSLPELRGRIHERCRVVAVARDKGSKTNPEGRVVGRAPFVLHLMTSKGERYENADVVIDASGVTTQPTLTGPGGLPAIGEGEVTHLIFRRLFASPNEPRMRFQGKRVLLIGNGHSAATALVAFDAMATAGAAPAGVHWIRRARAGSPYHEILDDPLPARAALARSANRIAAGAAWLHDLPGASVLAYKQLTWGLEALVRRADDEVETIALDAVYALTGFRPDIELFRELRVHLCYASEAPMALAAALQAARSGSTWESDCLKQTTHGAETLRTTEPGFFVIGAKSYGRSPDFLLRVGYEQVREVASLLEMTRPALAG